MIEKRAVRVLTNAIILQAVNDYRKALDGFCVGNKPNWKVTIEVERFFRSDWFKLMSEIDGEYLIRKLREEGSTKRTSKHMYNVDT